jgi:hypothetical protein
MIYALVFIGRSGEPFPDGIEIYALPYALEILEDTNVDTELWALRRWIIEDVGDEWRVEDLDATGRLYHLRAATTRYRDQCSPPVHSASALNSLASCRITPDSRSNRPTPGLAREHGLGVGEARVPALSDSGWTKVDVLSVIFMQQLRCQ